MIESKHKSATENKLHSPNTPTHMLIPKLLESTKKYFKLCVFHILVTNHLIIIIWLKEVSSINGFRWYSIVRGLYM